MMLSDRYELGDVIGTGGMADVYQAQDTLLGRMVAVKLMRPELARDADFRERFRREGQNAGRLNHPNIVAVYDTGEVPMDGTSVPYIVMELVHGRTLRDIIREDGPLAPRDAAKILVPVCEALQVSHDAGIIHRDVKPGNIMITNTGGVKVMDFGIARAVDDNTSAMTKTSAVIGTAQYLSPEQARGKKVGASSDVYALGCVFYETITGRPPFAGENPFSVAYQHVHEDPTKPSDFIPGLSPTAAVNVNAVALTAMAKHPADRYASAEQFAQDLRLLSRDSVTHAAQAHLLPRDDAPATTVFDAQQGGAQHRAPAAQPTAVTQQYQQQYQQQQPAQPNYPAQPAAAQQVQQVQHRKKGSNAGVWLASLLGVLIVGLGGVFAYTFFGNGGDAGMTQTAKTVTLPDVSGLNPAEAESKLLSLGLKVERVEDSSPTVPRGKVIATTPANGSQLPAGSTVTMTVSTGKEITDVPDVRGRTTKDAVKALEDAGLQLDVTVKEMPSDTVDAGKVIEQSPAAGNQVTKGTKVMITVSTGAEKVRVPVITGLEWSRAEGNLTSLGFVPQITMVDSAAPEGTVLSASQEGSELPKGATIQVEVSRGSQVNAPNLTGMVTTQALTALRAAGWTAPDSSLVVEQEPTGALIQQGKIASQSPAPGEPLDKNGVVTVKVYVFDLLKVGE